MLFHLSKCSTPANIVIWMADTDVLIIALGSLHFLAEGKQVWIETGLVTKSTFRYININQIHDHFGVGFYTALPVFHMFSGCDYTASFNQKGKIRPIKLLEKMKVFNRCFRNYVIGMQSQKKTSKLLKVLYVQCMEIRDSNPLTNYI